MSVQHASGIFGNDSVGYLPDCMDCDMSKDHKPMPEKDAQHIARFHFFLHNYWGK